MKSDEIYHNFNIYSIAILTMAICSSCSTQLVKSDTEEVKTFDSISLTKGIVSAEEKRKASLEVQDVSVNQSSLSKSNDKHEFSVYKNKHVEKWIHYFINKDQIRFRKFLSRGSYYKEVIQTILEEEELPSLLYYLPLIESGFNLKAHSRASAVGPWQFIRGTAKRYGLTVNTYIDERRDPIHSTQAASKYLSDLFNVFNSWELALAAYNCGELRVLRAIMKGKTRDFWKLVKMKLLPRETRNYVPKLLAAAHIGENLSHFKINLVDSISYPDVKLHEIPGGTKLTTISKILKIPYRELKNLNPALKRAKTPNWIKDYSIWFPPKYSNKVKKSFSKFVSMREWGKLNSSPNYHKVRSGDTLIGISKKYKISINKIKRFNKIYKSRIFIGQKLLLKTRNYKRVKGERFYFVKGNDYLGKIARKFGLNINYLQRLNGLHSSKVFVGQKLDVTKGIKTFKYRIKKGDNLIQIALLYRTSVKSLMLKNNLEDKMIFAGQTLKI
jgi:membrane-bound lytic murein transglycosylase D